MIGFVEIVRRHQNCVCDGGFRRREKAVGSAVGLGCRDFMVWRREVGRNAQPALFFDGGSGGIVDRKNFFVLYFVKLLFFNLLRR